MTPGPAPFAGAGPEVTPTCKRKEPEVPPSWNRTVTRKGHSEAGEFPTWIVSLRWWGSQWLAQEGEATVRRQRGPTPFFPGCWTVWFFPPVGAEGNLVLGGRRGGLADGAGWGAPERLWTREVADSPRASGFLSARRSSTPCPAWWFCPPAFITATCKVGGATLVLPLGK